MVVRTAKQFANGHPLLPLGKWCLGKRLHRMFWAVPAKKTPSSLLPNASSPSAEFHKAQQRRASYPCQFLNQTGFNLVSRGKSTFPVMHTKPAESAERS